MYLVLALLSANLRNFSLSFPTTRWWSDAASAPPFTRTFWICVLCKYDRFLCVQGMPMLFSEVLCGNSVPLITKLFVAQKSTKCNPSPFMTHSYSVSPIAEVKPVLSSPTLALKSPVITTISFPVLLRNVAVNHYITPPSLPYLIHLWERNTWSLWALSFLRDDRVRLVHTSCQDFFKFVLMLQRSQKWLNQLDAWWPSL